MTAKIFIAAPFPPPMGGAAKNTQVISEILESRNVGVVRYSTSISWSKPHGRSLIYHCARIVKACLNATGIVRRRDQASCVYVVPDGGGGVYYTLLYAVIVRACRLPLVFHHHSYRYVTETDRRWHLLCRLTGRHAVHVFLDPMMQARFIANYGTVESIVVPNCAITDNSAADTDGNMMTTEPTAGIAIGFLSNLSNDKGFQTVVQAFMRLSDDNTQFKFMLAGEPTGPAEMRQLCQLRDHLGTRLDYNGALYGSDKVAFFRRCDVFVFPSRFRQEAQPNVVFEALSAGCYVVATAHAGIPWMLRGYEAETIEVDDQLSDRVVTAVQMAVGGLDLQHVKKRNQERFLTQRERSIENLERLLDLLQGWERSRTR